MYGIGSGDIRGSCDSIQSWREGGLMRDEKLESIRRRPLIKGNGVSNIVYVAMRRKNGSADS